MMRQVRLRYPLTLLVGLAALVLGVVSPAAAPPLGVFTVPCTTAVTLTTTTETVVCTLSNVATSTGQTVRLLASTQVTTGTGATSLTVRLRRGATTAGPLIGAATTIQVTAGNTVAVPIGGEDAPGEVASQPYVLTAQQVAATANGSAVSSEIVALAW